MACTHEWAPCAQQPAGLDGLLCRCRICGEGAVAPLQTPSATQIPNTTWPPVPQRTDHPDPIGPPTQPPANPYALQLQQLGLSHLAPPAPAAPAPQQPEVAPQESDPSEDCKHMWTQNEICCSCGKDLSEPAAPSPSDPVLSQPSPADELFASMQPRTSPGAIGPSGGGAAGGAAVDPGAAEPAEVGEEEEEARSSSTENPDNPAWEEGAASHEEVEGLPQLERGTGFDDEPENGHFLHYPYDEDDDDLEFHPCERVWPEGCRFGVNCAFRLLPREWCLFCLRKAPHSQCEGITPPINYEPNNDVVKRCADRRVEKQDYELTPEKEEEIPEKIQRRLQLFRTSMCTAYQKNGTCNQEKCCFAHSIAARRTPEDPIPFEAYQYLGVTPPPSVAAKAASIMVSKKRSSSPVPGQPPPKGKKAKKEKEEKEKEKDEGKKPKEKARKPDSADAPTPPKPPAAAEPPQPQTQPENGKKKPDPDPAPAPAARPPSPVAPAPAAPAPLGAWGAAAPPQHTPGPQRVIAKAAAPQEKKERDGVKEARRREELARQKAIEEGMKNNPTSPSSLSYKRELYKTQMCARWEHTGSCRFGSTCPFAHGKAELHTPTGAIYDASPKDSGPLKFEWYRTRICPEWEKGKKCDESKCNYAHGTHKLRYCTDPLPADALARARRNKELQMRK